jgi:hypothetical protein
MRELEIEYLQIGLKSAQISTVSICSDALIHIRVSFNFYPTFVETQIMIYFLLPLFLVE